VGKRWVGIGKNPLAPAGALEHHDLDRHEGIVCRSSLAASHVRGTPGCWQELTEACTFNVCLLLAGCLHIMPVAPESLGLSCGGDIWSRPGLQVKTGAALSQADRKRKGLKQYTDASGRAQPAT
jgi:hypothetical protein